MDASKFDHLGQAILDKFRKQTDSICQIDAATGKFDTNASVLSRSIKVANSLRALGLAPGDILALSGKNHLDLHIPYYAALFNGLPLIGIDPLYKYDEIRYLFKLTSPKVAFCDPESYQDYVRSAQDLGLDTKIFTFGDGPQSMKVLVEKYGTDTKEEDFQLAEIDPNKAIIWLISTSGSTGAVKVAAFTHASMYQKALQYLRAIKIKGSSPAYRPALNPSPIQWVSGNFNLVSMPLLHQTMVQTSAPLTVEHLIDIINKYRPTQTMIGPTMMANILKHEKPCDLTCFDSIILGGAKVPGNLTLELRSKLRKGAVAVEMLGQTETIGPVLFPTPNTPHNSVGSPTPSYQTQLVDPETETVITEPNVPGELWVKGIMFVGYYNNPEETAKAFSKDGWFKTGDLLYRDEKNNYFYLSRIKTLIKYQNYHVVPGELEDVIRSHPGVYDVLVTGAPHPSDGEHPVACVVRKHGSDVTAQEIQDLVAEKLSEKKQIRGGVIFMKELPLTSTGKVNFAHLKKMVQNLYSN